MTAANPHYWPAWAGALSLGAVALSFCWLAKRPLGVSGYIRKITRWREERAAEAREQSLPENPIEVQAALLRATLEEFKDQLSAEQIGDLQKQLVELESALASDCGAASCDAPLKRRLPASSALGFVLALSVGGALASLLRGDWQLQLSMPEAYIQVYGPGWLPWIVLPFGGFLVGWGTSMAGGCTSGHGLNGCARFQPGSLAATATFFGVAALVTVIMISLHAPK